MSFHTYNGVFPEEKRMGQRLEIDVELTYPIEEQVKNDDLTETVSYADVYDTIERFVLNHNYNLIESLANNVLQTLLADYPMITEITLKVRKYSVPIAGIFDNIEIEVSGSNSND
ncbi:dihydroneopterin aldolase [Paucilactobacillus oligofermentans DSM 15707 = LMG 22743]|uniref:7,8-dihydroneopterin aldolase n=2 Tax=Paucilactobacillus oligofermentans TaxID=293371 RepID=A0A0R1RGP1_9LACO|nr:dihydroneopterin aldolase [Paucilactobacillus oligofermentans DSM 15707 = LMG 22743]CUS25986.1 Dihydroneopterin aldolase [Paucilactobacillus oligofermentans DSM 15707 = LMG 22743]